MSFPEEYPEFITVTCLDWKYLLGTDTRKNIIVDSLRFLSQDARAIIYAFVIMSNHFHLIWQFHGGRHGSVVLRDFLKYTSQQLLRNLAEQDMKLHEELRVNDCDRIYQVWERNSLRTQLWTQKVFNQKLNYIHWNPVKAGLCEFPEQYRYSSASFYILNETEWDFLSHADG
jgi:REP element-mobilizing transposase RayT